MKMEALLAAALVHHHPLEVVRLSQGRSPEHVASMLKELPAEHVAGVLRAFQPDLAAEVLYGLGAEAESVVEVLGLPATAALALRLPAEHRVALCARLQSAQRDLLVRMLKYPPDSVGSVTDPHVVTVSERMTVADAANAVRLHGQSASHYLYVLSDGGQLTGSLTLTELLRSKPERLISQVAVAHPETLSAVESLGNAVRHIGWERYHTLPVVDSDGRFLGALRYRKLREIERAMGSSPARAEQPQASAALAEVYAVGTVALMRWAGALISPDDQEGSL